MDSKNKNVLHVVTVSFVINHFFGKQFKYLKDKTDNNYFLACSDSPEFKKLAEKLQYIPFTVEITRQISPIADLKAIYQLSKFIKKNNIDTIVGHTPKGGMVAMLAAFLAGKKERIYFRHGIIYETSKGVKRLLLKSIDRLSGNLANRVVCVSKSVEEISNRDRLNDPRKNVILGMGTCNGIDTNQKFNPQNFTEIQKIELRQKLGIDKGDIVIGYVGRLVKDKGINELIDAWKLLEKNYLNIKLLLVGPIEERDAISILSQNEIKSNKNIIYTDFVNEASPYFSIMDIFVLPTYREGFPTVALEASAMELPIIITRATGCTESIIENETGLFVKNEVLDIKNKILYYIDNEDLRKKHGAKGREFVVENFHETKIWDIIHSKLGY